MCVWRLPPSAVVLASTMAVASPAWAHKRAACVYIRHVRLYVSLLQLLCSPS